MVVSLFSVFVYAQRLVPGDASMSSIASTLKSCLWWRSRFSVFFQLCPSKSTSRPLGSCLKVERSTSSGPVASLSLWILVCSAYLNLAFSSALHDLCFCQIIGVSRQLAYLPIYIVICLYIGTWTSRIVAFWVTSPFGKIFLSHCFEPLRIRRSNGAARQFEEHVPTYSHDGTRFCSYCRNHSLWWRLPEHEGTCNAFHSDTGHCKQCDQKL